MPAVGGSIATDVDLRMVAADKAIDNFAAFVSAPRARDVAGRMNEYTAEGIRRLAIAINMLAIKDAIAGGALGARIEKLLERARALHRDTNADTHALKTREAFLLVGSILEGIQDRRFQNLDGQAAAVLRAAEEVTVREPLTEQAEAVEAFFDRAATLLGATARITGYRHPPDDTGREYYENEGGLMIPNAIPYLLNPLESQDEERRRGAQPPGANGRLAELRHLDDYVMADGDPDIRGWEVKTAARCGDRAVGSVEDLIVDRDTLSVRYLLVCLNKDAVTTTRDRRILVPVGVARLDEHEDQVRLDGYTAAQLVGIPEFRPGKLTRHYEAIVRRRFVLPEPKAGPRARRAADFYEQSEFDDRAFWGVRRRGRARIPYLTRRGDAR